MTGSYMSNAAIFLVQTGGDLYILAVLLRLLLGWVPGMVTALAVTGLITLWQVLAWKPWAVRQVPLLWILYLGHAALGTGLLVAALQASSWVLRLAWPVHVIGVAGFAVLIIGMVTRTALGHLGQTAGQAGGCRGGATGDY